MTVLSLGHFSGADVSVVESCSRLTNPATEIFATPDASSSDLGKLKRKFCWNSDGFLVVQTDKVMVALLGF